VDIVTATRPGFDDVDLSTMTTVELAEYMAQLQMTVAGVDDPFVDRAYNLRISEVSCRIAEIQREIATRNADETARQDPQ
jgi:hypothetical protein